MASYERRAGFDESGMPYPDASYFNTGGKVA
jgi:hypothetical protein